MFESAPNKEVRRQVLSAFLRTFLADLSHSDLKSSSDWLNAAVTSQSSYNTICCRFSASRVWRSSIILIISFKNSDARLNLFSADVFQIRREGNNQTGA